MIRRRDVIAGLGCAAAFGTAEWLRPRRFLRLLPDGTTLEQVIPKRFPGWVPGGKGDIVIPRSEGTLASRLYTEQLARTFRPATATDDSEEIMLLAAYGKAQSDSLQLHRPEVCYPANGFAITARRFIDLPIAGRTIPAVLLTAVGGDRVEDILYWTRLGHDLPRTASEQRSMRLRAAMRGYIGDGLLVRASSVRTGDTPSFELLSRFAIDLVNAVAPANRPALIGDPSQVA